MFTLSKAIPASLLVLISLSFAAPAFGHKEQAKKVFSELLEVTQERLVRLNNSHSTNGVGTRQVRPLPRQEAFNQKVKPNRPLHPQHPLNIKSAHRKKRKAGQAARRQTTKFGRYHVDGS